MQIRPETSTRSDVLHPPPVHCILFLALWPKEFAYYFLPENILRYYKSEHTLAQVLVEVQKLLSLVFDLTQENSLVIL